MTARPGSKWVEVGTGAHRIAIVPRAEKGGVVYLRWRSADKSNWRWKSLGFRYAGATAKDRKVLEAQAYQAALDHYERLVGRKAVGSATPARVLRLADAWNILTDPSRGRYPTDSVYRRELEAALREAARMLGPDFPWSAFDAARLREVTRRRAREIVERGGVGFRAAQVLGIRLCTIARVLQSEGLLPADYVAPGGKSWVAELRTFVEAARGDAIPAPHRPRYTLEEFRGLLAASGAVDARFHLMLTLGAQLRAAQVARAKRSHLDLDAGTFQVFGRGKKGGTILTLTAGQRAIVEAALTTGYLSAVEQQRPRTGADFLLFPSTLTARGFATGTARAVVSRSQVKKWIREAEAIAGIAHVPGRSWYGGRRALVDGSLDAGISGEGLETLGGWANRRVADEVYRQRNRETARGEASSVLAQLRGETSGPTSDVPAMQEIVAPQIVVEGIMLAHWEEVAIVAAKWIEHEADPSRQPPTAVQHALSIAHRLRAAAFDMRAVVPRDREPSTTDGQ